VRGGSSAVELAFLDATTDALPPTT
jgi:hypothetical protein